MPLFSLLFTVIPVKYSWVPHHTIWEQKGEEYRLTGNGGWVWTGRPEGFRTRKRKFESVSPSEEEVKNKRVKLEHVVGSIKVKKKGYFEIMMKKIKDEVKMEDEVTDEKKDLVVSVDATDVKSSNSDISVKDEDKNQAHVKEEMDKRTKSVFTNSDKNGKIKQEETLTEQKPAIHNQIKAEHVEQKKPVLQTQPENRDFIDKSVPKAKPDVNKQHANDDLKLKYAESENPKRVDLKVDSDKKLEPSRDTEGDNEEIDVLTVTSSSLTVHVPISSTLSSISSKGAIATSIPYRSAAVRSRVNFSCTDATNASDSTLIQPKSKLESHETNATSNLTSPADGKQQQEGCSSSQSSTNIQVSSSHIKSDHVVDASKQNFDLQLSQITRESNVSQKNDMTSLIDLSIDTYIPDSNRAVGERIVSAEFARAAASAMNISDKHKTLIKNDHKQDKNKKSSSEMFVNKDNLLTQLSVTKDILHSKSDTSTCNKTTTSSSGMALATSAEQLPKGSSSATLSISPTSSTLLSHPTSSASNSVSITVNTQVTTTADTPAVSISSSNTKLSSNATVLTAIHFVSKAEESSVNISKCNENVVSIDKERSDMIKHQDSSSSPIVKCTEEMLKTTDSITEAKPCSSGETRSVASADTLNLTIEKYQVTDTLKKSSFMNDILDKVEKDVSKLSSKKEAFAKSPNVLVKTDLDARTEKQLPNLLEVKKISAGPGKDKPPDPLHLNENMSSFKEYEKEVTSVLNGIIDIICDNELKPQTKSLDNQLVPTEKLTTKVGTNNSPSIPETTLAAYSAISSNGSQEKPQLGLTPSGNACTGTSSSYVTKSSDSNAVKSNFLKEASASETKEKQLPNLGRSNYASETTKQTMLSDRDIPALANIRDHAKLSSVSVSQALPTAVRASTTPLLSNAAKTTLSTINKPISSDIPVSSQAISALQQKVQKLESKASAILNPPPKLTSIPKMPLPPLAKVSAPSMPTVAQKTLAQPTQSTLIGGMRPMIPIAPAPVAAQSGMAVLNFSGANAQIANANIIQALANNQALQNAGIQIIQTSPGQFIIRAGTSGGFQVTPGTVLMNNTAMMMPRPTGVVVQNLQSHLNTAVPNATKIRPVMTVPKSNTSVVQTSKPVVQTLTSKYPTSKPGTTTASNSMNSLTQPSNLIPQYTNVTSTSLTLSSKYTTVATKSTASSVSISSAAPTMSWQKTLNAKAAALHAKLPANAKLVSAPSKTSKDPNVSNVSSKTVTVTSGSLGATSSSKSIVVQKTKEIPLTVEAQLLKSANKNMRTNRKIVDEPSALIKHELRLYKEQRKGIKGIFVLNKHKLRSLAKSGGLREVENFRYDRQSSTWPKEFPRPNFRLAWRHRLVHAQSYAAVGHLLRILHCCLRWDVINIRPPKGVSHSISTTKGK